MLCKKFDTLSHPLRFSNFTGILMGIEMEKQAYETKKTEKPIWDSDETEVNLKSVSNGVEIPQDLICPVCKDLLKVCKVILKKREGRQ